MRLVLGLPLQASPSTDRTDNVFDSSFSKNVPNKQPPILVAVNYVFTRAYIDSRVALSFC